MSDDLFFFGSLGVWVVFAIIIILYRIKNRKTRNFIFFLIVNVVIGLILSCTWFTQIAKDGVSEMTGIFLYGIVALIFIIIGTIVCNIKGSNHHMDITK